MHVGQQRRSLQTLHLAAAHALPLICISMRHRQLSEGCSQENCREFHLRQLPPCLWLRVWRGWFGKCEESRGQGTAAPQHLQPCTANYCESREQWGCAAQECFEEQLCAPALHWAPEPQLHPECCEQPASMIWASTCTANFACKPISVLSCSSSAKCAVCHQLRTARAAQQSLLGAGPLGAVAEQCQQQGVLHPPFSLLPACTQRESCGSLPCCQAPVGA